MVTGTGAATGTGAVGVEGSGGCSDGAGSSVLLSFRRFDTGGEPYGS